MLTLSVLSPCDFPNINDHKHADRTPRIQQHPGENNDPGRIFGRYEDSVQKLNVDTIGDVSYYHTSMNTSAYG